MAKGSLLHSVHSVKKNNNDNNKSNPIIFKYLKKKKNVITRLIKNKTS